MRSSGCVRSRSTTLTVAIWFPALLLTANVQLVCAERAGTRTSVLFRESFDDAALPGRGWYDGRTVAVSPERTFQGEGCIEYHWKPGATTPERSSSLRRMFDP